MQPSHKNSAHMDEVSFLKERLAFVEQQYKDLQLNMKHQRQASLEAARLQVETNTHFLLGLAPRRYRLLQSRDITNIFISCAAMNR